jgi:hypothetical protein
MITFQKEEFHPFISEAKDLLKDHYNEIAQRTDIIKLDPDWKRYTKLYNANRLEVHTAREDGKLIGYSLWFLFYHIHYQHSFTATSDVLYLSPECRKGMAGIKFIKWTTEEIKKRKPQRILFHVKPFLDYGPILERLGAGYFEKSYSIVLE